MAILTKSVELELKSLTDDGKFTGYGSVFGNVDKGGDIVIAGAFENSLKKWKSSGRQVPVLWQHKPDEPIGSWPELKEDDHGLIGDADLWIEDAPYARLAHRGMKAKTITGLSIGYHVLREEFDKKSGTNRLIELGLAEISVVTNPMNDEARISNVKAMIKEGNLPTLREFEELLRDEWGFSKMQAQKIASHGLQQLLRGDPGGEKGETQILSALRGFTI